MPQGYAQRSKDLIKGTAILWLSGTTFRNACDIMTLYVTGLLPTSPSHAGPILSESRGIGPAIAQCNRNGLLTVASEPAQTDYNIRTGQPYTVENASIEIYVRNHNLPLLLGGLEAYGEQRFDIQYPTSPLSHDLGPSYKSEDQYCTSLFITDNQSDTNEMYNLLAAISGSFTEFPVAEIE